MLKSRNLILIVLLLAIISLAAGNLVQYRNHRTDKNEKNTSMKYP